MTRFYIKCNIVTNVTLFGPLKDSRCCSCSCSSCCGIMNLHYQIYIKQQQIWSHSDPNVWKNDHHETKNNYIEKCFLKSKQFYYWHSICALPYSWSIQALLVKVKNDFLPWEAKKSNKTCKNVKRRMMSDAGWCKCLILYLCDWSVALHQQGRIN